MVEFLGMFCAGFAGLSIAGYVFAEKAAAGKRIAAAVVLTLITLVAVVVVVLSGKGIHAVFIAGVVIAAAAEFVARKMPGRVKVISGAAVALVAVVAISYGMSGKKETPAAVAIPAAVVPVERVESSPGAMACECGSGAECTGPKGGKYCINKSGNKKYL